MGKLWVGGQDRYACNRLFGTQSCMRDVSPAVIVIRRLISNITGMALFSSLELGSSSI